EKSCLFLGRRLCNGISSCVAELVVGKFPEIFRRGIVICPIIKMTVLWPGGNESLVKSHCVLIIDGITAAEASHEVINCFWHRSISFWFVFWEKPLVFEEVIHLPGSTIEVGGAHFPCRVRWCVSKHY